MAYFRSIFDKNVLSEAFLVNIRCVSFNFEHSLQFRDRLLELGADINYIEPRGTGALFSAISSGAPFETIKWLIDHGASANEIFTPPASEANNDIDDSDEKSEDARAPLTMPLIAISLCSLNSVSGQSDASRMIDLLFERGASVNAVNADGNTCLHIAVSLDWHSCIDVLLRYEADTSIKNKIGQSPIEMATESNMWYLPFKYVSSAKTPSIASAAAPVAVS